MTHSNSCPIVSSRPLNQWPPRLGERKPMKTATNTAQEYAEEEFDKAIAKICCDVSMSRHVGHVEVVHTPLGDMYYQTGKDLSDIKYVIGTGGVLISNKDAKNILRQVNKKSNRLLELRPNNPSYLIDTSYILSAMGLLSQKYPKVALKLMKQYLL